MADSEKKLEPGSTIQGGSVKLLSRLGLGGFGEVFLARTASGLKAIKVVDTSVWSQAEYQVFNTMLMSEASFLSTLDHPALPKSGGFFAEGHRYFLVMDWVQGQTLEQYVEQNGALDLDELFGLVGVLTNVLSYLHRECRGAVVFGDLKPANVLRTGPQKYRLVDLGLVSRKGTKMSRKFAVFSPHFSAPEQARGVPSHPAQDIFSLGATVYYALSATEPEVGFSAQDLQKVMRRSLGATTPNWGEASMHCLKKLLTLLLGAMDPDPDGRPRSISAIHDAWVRTRQARERERVEMPNQMDDIVRLLYKDK
jgi:serine/threonine protein kinase